LKTFIVLVKYHDACKVWGGGPHGAASTNNYINAFGCPLPVVGHLGNGEPFSPQR
jgi:hypothetical protein